MITALFLPDLPARAAQDGLGVSDPVLVESRGRIVSPRSLAGLPTDRAKGLIPEALVVVRRPALEHAYWDRVLEAVFTITPLIVCQGPGRLLCAPDDVPRLRRLIEATEAQAGFARTRTLAMIAALTARPGGIVTVDDDDISRFLERTPVSVLCDIPELELDESTVERLQLFGLGSIGRLRMLTRRHLEAQFGDLGLRLHGFVQSVSAASPLPMYRPAPEIRERERFDDDEREPDALIAAAEVCLDRALVRLDRRRTVRLEVALLNRADVPAFRSARVLRIPLSDKPPLLTQIATMIRSLSAPDRRVWGVGLRLATLLPPAVEQLPLFRPRPTPAEITAPLARRFPNAIKRIHVLDPYAYLPEKFCSMH